MNIFSCTFLKCSTTIHLPSECLKVDHLSFMDTTKKKKKNQRDLQTLIYSLPPIIFHHFHFCLLIFLFYSQLASSNLFSFVFTISFILPIILFPKGTVKTVLPENLKSLILEIAGSKHHLAITLTVSFTICSWIDRR